MDSNDSRRSRVPLGTFVSSLPPPPPSVPAPPPAPAQGARARYDDTLVGAGALGRRDASEELEQPSDASPKPVSNTLVGHPTTPSIPSGAPVLAPPKWRGVQAYVEGEPQPRMSVISAAPPMFSSPPDTRALPSKVTTKVGLPQAVIAQPSAPHALDSLATEAPAVPTLEEYPVDEIEELALDDLLEQASNSEPPLAPIAASAKGSSDTSTISTVPPPRTDMLAEPMVVRSQPPTAPVGVPLAAIRLQRQAPVATATREHVEIAPHDARQGPPAQAAKPPAKARKAAQPNAAARERSSDARSGIWLVAAMVLLGVGGWQLTSGGYVRRVVKAAPAAVAAPAASAQPPQEKAVEKAIDPAELPAQELQAQELQAQELGDVASEPTPDTKPARPSAVAPSTTRPQPQRSPAIAAQPQSPALRVTPRGEAGELPEIPSREDVLSALDPLRKAALECVEGQHGVAQLDITVANSGVVTNAVVGGDFAGKQAGSCIARVVRTARFVRFSKPRFRVIYPFSL